MDYGVAVCRAIMRIYSFFELDSSYKLIPKNAEDVLLTYLQLEPQLKRAFCEEGIQMYPAGVHSCFGHAITIVPEVFFIYLNASFLIPFEILQCLKQFLRKENMKTEEQKLFLAYSGRWFNIENGDRFITDGLQTSSKIVIDFFTYTIASVDCLHHRLIHELLHVLGVEETEMDQLILPACSATYETSKSFVKSVANQAYTVQNKFVQAANALVKKEPQLSQRVLQLANMLCLYGFPEQISTSLYATTYMPSKLLPELQIEGYEVLFM